MIIDASSAPPQGSLSCDVVVIGSGSGGATAARVLAEAGKDVLILEEGADRTGAALTQRDGEMYDQLYMERGGRATDDLSITVLQGRVLGGGGVINASDVVPIPAGVLAHWRKRYGLTSFTDEALAKFRDEALADLSASRIPDEQLNAANLALKRGAEKLGLRGENLMHNRVGCAGLGTCLIGCPINAKRNPRFVAIPRALAAGARVIVRARAVKLLDAALPIKRVEVRALDERGYRERGSFEVHAPVVVLAANAVASAQLLLRSGVGNTHVGRHLSLQPQLPVVARFREPVDAFSGIPQAYAITEHEVEDHPEHGLHGFRIEAIMGTPGIVSTLLPYSGARAKEAMTTYRRYAASLLLVPDDPTGTVAVADDGRPVIRYQHTTEHKARLREAIRIAARVYLAAGADEVEVPVAGGLRLASEADIRLVDDIGFEPCTAPLLSAHQQGGVRMAPSEREGAANPEGLVYGTRDVYVFDSSGFPSSASSHTMAPIITTSLWLSSQLAARL
jgi:choline dehydrogenase-like flavoprotein